MRIAVDLLFIQPGRNRGTETYVHGLLSSFTAKQRGDLVLFVSDVNREAFAEFGEATVVETGISGKNRLRRLVFQQTVLPGLVRKHRCDLLFCPGYLSPLVCPVPIVVAIHDTQFLDIPAAIPFGQLCAYRGLVPAGARRAAAIVTLSEFSKSRITKGLKVRPEKVFVTHLAPKGFGTVDAEPEEARLFLEQHRLVRPYILSVSNRYPHKNIIGLVKGFIKFKAATAANIDLVFIGSGSGIEEARLGIQSRDDIKFLGYVGDRELRIAYRRAHGFVLASLYEGFGLPVLEAMSFGIPVACSNVASLPEVAGGAAFLFDPRDEQAIADSLHILYSNRGRRAAAVGDGYRNLERFSWAKCAEETLVAFRSAGPK